MDAIVKRHSGTYPYSPNSGNNQNTMAPDKQHAHQLLDQLGPQMLAVLLQTMARPTIGTPLHEGRAVRQNFTRAEMQRLHLKCTICRPVWLQGGPRRTMSRAGRSEVTFAWSCPSLHSRVQEASPTATAS